MVEGPYTTLTVKEYVNLQETILNLRRTIQKARQALSKEDLKGAVEILVESDI